MSDGKRGDESRLKFIREKYGELLTIAEIAEVLKYKTVYAVKKAHLRGHLPIELKRFPHRRGLFATAEAVSRCLEELDSTEV